MDALGPRLLGEPEDKKTPEPALAKGDFKFTLEGERLHGSFVLVRMDHDRGTGQVDQLAADQTPRGICRRDERRNGVAVLEENNTSVASRRTMEAIAAGKVAGRSRSC